MALFYLVVLGLAVICIVIDWLTTRDVAAASRAPTAAGTGHLPLLGPPERAQGGVRWHPEMAYHPGHTWVLPLGPQRARVGIDEYVAGLLGTIDALELPRPGQRLTQGRAGWYAHVAGWRIPLQSPVSGWVSSVNSAAALTPRLVSDDAHERGWLLEVDTEDLRANLNNLLPPACVRPWLEADRTRIRGELPPPDAGPVSAAPPWLTRVARVLVRADLPLQRAPAAAAEVARELLPTQRDIG